MATNNIVASNYDIRCDHVDLAQKSQKRRSAVHKTLRQTSTTGAENIGNCWSMFDVHQNQFLWTAVSGGI
jgi:hypothetical protein